MAKGLRSKVKRSFRRAKREDSVYAATHAARVNRLHSKLANKLAAAEDGEVKMVGEDGEEREVPDDAQVAEPDTLAAQPEEESAMDGVAVEGEGKVSTSGRRDTRRVEWNKAKGIRKPSRSRAKMMGATGGGKAQRRR